MKLLRNEQIQQPTLYDLLLFNTKGHNISTDSYKSLFINLASSSEANVLCVKEYFGVCLVKPSENMAHPIFGFSEFISALALLGIIYTISNILHKFRLAVGWSWISIKLIITFFALLVLVTDIWFSKQWLVPNFLDSQILVQGGFGILVIWFVYKVHTTVTKPSEFHKKNNKVYFEELKNIIKKGDEKELSVIADELRYSAKSLIELSTEVVEQGNNNKYAEILNLIGDKKLCKQIIVSSPDTAEIFFNTMAEQQKYPKSIGDFINNISVEALMNKDSRLHQENTCNSGLLSYTKPFSNALYGNYKLIEALYPNSPLDIPYDVLNSQQLELYLKVLLITIKSYLIQTEGSCHPRTLKAAFATIRYPCRNLYKFNNINSEILSNELYKQFNVIVQSVNKVVDCISQLENPQPEAYIYLYNQLVDFILEIIKDTAKVQWSPNIIWHIHCDIIWHNFFNQIIFVPKGQEIKKKVWEIINNLLYKALLNKILELEKGSYEAASVFGLLLNVLGLIIREEENNEQKKIHLNLLKWIKKNYLRLRADNLCAANLLLVHQVRYDDSNKRIIRTNANGNKQYLHLEELL